MLIRKAALKQDIDLRRSERSFPCFVSRPLSPTMFFSTQATKAKQVAFTLPLFHLSLTNPSTTTIPSRRIINRRNKNDDHPAFRTIAIQYFYISWSRRRRPHQPWPFTFRRLIIIVFVAHHYHHPRESSYVLQPTSSPSLSALIAFLRLHRRNLFQWRHCRTTFCWMHLLLCKRNCCMI